jgi:hypothetical protein
LSPVFPRLFTNIRLGNLGALEAATDDPFVERGGWTSGGVVFEGVVEDVKFVANRFGGGHLELIPLVEVGGLGAAEGDIAAQADIRIVDLNVTGALFPY